MYFPNSKIFHPLSARPQECERRAQRNVRTDSLRKLDSIVEEGNMSDDNLDNIFKALRVVPEFDGNPNVLVRFINLCDQIIENYVKPTAGNDLNNLAVLNGILNKITGSASRTLATNGIPSTWAGIRESLINNFSDRRDETALYMDLSTMTQGRDTPQIFYEKCQHMLSSIATYVRLHESVASTITSKVDLYKNLALQTYLRGLSEPLGSRIRSMRPDSLEKALEFAQGELNVIYLQNKQKFFETAQKPHFSNHNNYRRFYDTAQYFQQQPQPQQQPPRFDNNTNPIRYQSNPQQQAGPSRTQQMLRALPRSNMSTGFRIPQRPQFPQQQQNYPRPMSGVSHFGARTLAPTRYNPNFKTETNMHDSQNYDPNYPNNGYYDDYDYNYDYNCVYHYEQNQFPEDIPSEMFDHPLDLGAQALAQETDTNAGNVNENFFQALEKTSPR